jgi:hypothetical protein
MLWEGMRTLTGPKAIQVISAYSLPLAAIKTYCFKASNDNAQILFQTQA